MYNVDFKYNLLVLKLRPLIIILSDCDMKVLIIFFSSNDVKFSFYQRTGYFSSGNFDFVIS